MKQTDVWVVIPMYNEGSIVYSVVSDLLSRFDNVVCVDDGSTDDSVGEALRGGAVVVRHPINLGQGAALQTGINFALAQPRTSYIVTFDSDGQHSVADAERMVHRLRHEAIDIVIGSRFLDGRSNASPLKRVVLKTAVLFERITTGIKLTDAHNGLRAMNLKAANKIRITQNRMAHASELVAQIAACQLRYVEEPTQITYSAYSKAKGQSLWNSFNILTDLFFK